MESAHPASGSSPSAHTQTHTEAAASTALPSVDNGATTDAAASPQAAAGFAQGAASSSASAASASAPLERGEEKQATESSLSAPSLFAFSAAQPSVPSPLTSSHENSTPAVPAPTAFTFGGPSAVWFGPSSESSASPADPADKEDEHTKDELNAAAQLILDRAVRIDAELRALPPPLFHGCPLSAYSPPLDLAAVHSGQIYLNFANTFGRSRSLPAVLLYRPGAVDVTLSVWDRVARAYPHAANVDQLCDLALVQLRVERHEQQEIIRSSMWKRTMPDVRSAQLGLAWILWTHATFDRWLPAEINATAACESFALLCKEIRPAHALHLLASLDDATLLAFPRHAMTAAIAQFEESAQRQCFEMATQWQQHVEAIATARHSGDEDQQREALASLRRWISEKQSTLPPLLVESAILEARNLRDIAVSLLAPLVDDLTARINLAERFNDNQALLSRLLHELDSDPAVAPTEPPPTAPQLPQLLLTRLAQRIRAQSDEQLERDSAFEAVAAVCCEIPLPEGSVAHSVADHLLGRLSRRLLASGARMCLTPRFRWTDLLDHPRFSPSSAWPAFAVITRPTVRLLWAHGLTVNHHGTEYCVAALEDQILDNDAAEDLFSAECEDLSTHDVDWLSPVLSVPLPADPMIGGRPQSLLLDGSSFEEEHIKFIDATEAAQSADPSSAALAASAGPAASVAASSSSSSSPSSSFAPPYEHFANWGDLGSRELIQWIQSNAQEAAADPILSRPAFNLLSAAKLSSPILDIGRFDLLALPAEFSERMAQLGRASDCFSGVALAPFNGMPDCDLLRRLETRAVQYPKLRPRLAVLRFAAFRWFHRCFPQLRAEIECHLIPDLSSIVLSYVTASERVLRSLPPPPPLPLPALGAFAPPSRGLFFGGDAVVPNAFAASSSSWSAGPVFGSASGLSTVETTGTASGSGGLSMGIPAVPAAADSSSSSSSLQPSFDGFSPPMHAPLSGLVPAPQHDALEAAALSWFGAHPPSFGGSSFGFAAASTAVDSAADSAADSAVASPAVSAAPVAAPQSDSEAPLLDDRTSSANANRQS